MPRKIIPLTDAQRVKAHLAKTAVQRSVTRSRDREREIRALVLESTRQDNEAAWKEVWEVLSTGASPTMVAQICGVSRSLLYQYRDRYVESMRARGLEPEDEVVENRDPWSIAYSQNGEWDLSHPDLGLYRAMFEADGSLTIWKPGTVYRPISRENADVREGGEWTAEHELVYDKLYAQRDEWIAAGEPDRGWHAEGSVLHEEPDAAPTPPSLDFMDSEDDETSW